MDRVIYCPDETHLEEAQKLSRLHLVPILIGDNERTSELNFDRSKPIPLSIPVHHYCTLTPPQPLEDELFTFRYVNEFINFNDNFYFTLFRHIVKEPNGHVRLIPSVLERHFAEFNVRIGTESPLSFVLWKDEEQYLWINEFEVMKRENNE